MGIITVGSMEHWGGAIRPAMERSSEAERSLTRASFGARTRGEKLGNECRGVLLRLRPSFYRAGW
jgi:hypothetical protein